VSTTGCSPSRPPASRSSTSSTSRALDKTVNTGALLEAANGADLEFRVDSSGDVFCDGSFQGGGADYAEWLPLADPTEELAPGDVVGVSGGRVSRRTAGAHQ
jgi:hypothetical protein